MAGLSRSGSYSAAHQGHIPVIRFGRLKNVPGELWRRMLRGEVLPVIARSEMAAQRPALPDAASRGKSAEHPALIRRSRRRHVRGVKGRGAVIANDLRDLFMRRPDAGGFAQQKSGPPVRAVRN